MTETRLERYRRLTLYTDFLGGVVFLIGFCLRLDPRGGVEEHAIASTMMLVGWLYMAGDFAIELALADDRKRYLSRNVLTMVAIAVPPLRALMVIRALQSALLSPQRMGASGGRMRLYALYLTTLTVGFGSLLVVVFEREDPQANIQTFGNGMWWVMETVSTVGYGDYYPVTVPGRVVAVVLFINGVALLSVVTASLAQFVMGERGRTETGEVREYSMSEMVQKLERIEAKLERELPGQRQE